MNGQEAANERRTPPEPQPSTPEQLPTSERSPWRYVPDWAATIAKGVRAAADEHREIDDQTARNITHVLGAALGRDSHATSFSRLGGDSYDDLRDEYLTLYNDPDTPAEVREWIDWLGTYLIARETSGEARQPVNEQLPPEPTPPLARTVVYIRGQPFTVHFPASLGAEQVDAAREELTNLDLDRDDALQAFLSLPDIDATTPTLMEVFDEAYIGVFRTANDIVRSLLEVTEWEEEAKELTLKRGIFIDAISVDDERLLHQVREAYDIVEWEGRFYVFAK